MTVHTTTHEQVPVLLLVDDSPAIHRLLAVKLKDEGIEFCAAFSGEEAIELAQSQQPSLILLDMIMPGLTGLETLRRLKADRQTMDIPVIILSGNTESEDKVACFEAGAMDYVTKPFDVHELRARIHSALRLHKLMRMLEQRAQIDGLTGLWNRNYFNERLAAELNASRRGDSPISLVMCDLDHFKKLNDGFGHPAGDAVLQAFAAILGQEIRTYDIACRYGGEEFALILPGANVMEAAGVCERIRKALESRVFRKYPNMRVTGSFGVTDRPITGANDPAGWIEAADRALYSAKQGGRNRVHAYDDKLGAGHPLPTKSTPAVKAA